MKKKAKIYTEADKLELITLFINSGVSKRKFSDEYGLGHCTLSEWIANFASSNVITDTENTMSKNPKKNYRELELELEAENRRLKEALETEKLRSLAFNTMIDIAEEQFNIPIRKKAGAKQ